LRLLASVAAGVLFAACGQTPKSANAPGGAPASEKSQALMPEYDSAGKLTKLSYDRDHDGTLETWGYMDGARIVRVEVDENGDGTVDRCDYHSADAAPAPLEHAGPYTTI
jgi:hypothetical protein